MIRFLITAFFLLFGSMSYAADDNNVLVLKIKGKSNGIVQIELLPKTAPLHVAQIKKLTRDGTYNGVVFHRVIDGFMAQTGDVQYGRYGKGTLNEAGLGGSELPDIKAEFSKIPFDKGVVGMARSQDPNSANSQFFIMLAPGHFLNGEYTVIGKVIKGQEVVDAIKLGKGQSGKVAAPDYIEKANMLGE